MPDTTYAERPAGSRIVTWVERFAGGIYFAIVLLLAVAAIGLLLRSAALVLWHFDVVSSTSTVVSLLDMALLMFVLAELLHTVAITLRDRSLEPEPFLIIGVIAGVRRILVITAEAENGVPGQSFEKYAVELSLLIVLVVAMVVALVLWRHAYRDEPGSKP